MIVAIHQAEHLPWFGYFHKMIMSDIFVILDNVQFKKNYFENRNRIYTNQGLKYITLPVKMKGHLEKTFKEIELIDNWKKKYIKTLEQNYKKAPFAKQLENIIEIIELYKGNSLYELNMNIIYGLRNLLDINTKIIEATSLYPEGSKTELLIDILTKLKGASYIVGKSGFDYMDLSLFEKHSINLIEHKVIHPKYIPFNYKEFSEYPSIIDIIANLGKDKVKILLNENS